MNSIATSSFQNDATRISLKQGEGCIRDDVGSMFLAVVRNPFPDVDLIPVALHAGAFEACLHPQNVTVDPFLVL
jgi:hypothetical protein